METILTGIGFYAAVSLVIFLYFCLYIFSIYVSIWGTICVVKALFRCLFK
jgi:hypothetical protein